MTQKGRKNHYNVKLLAGYGLAVKLHNNKIILKNGHNPFSEKQDIEEWFITQLPYKKIVISGRGYISTDAIEILCTHYKNIVITDSYGHPISFISGLMDSMTASSYRIAQYDAFRDPEKCEYLSRKTILAKLDSQIRFLNMLKRNDSSKIISILRNYRKELENGLDITKTEAKASRAYFAYYSSLFDSKYQFDSRNQSSLKISKRNASDPINALLNYGYAVLAGEISKYVNGFGLDAFYGYMHKQHSGFPALVYDVIEPFRWLVEYAVYHIANTIDSRHCIRMKDFAWTKDGSIVLSYDLKKKFLEKLERIFQIKREYRFKYARSKNNGLNNCEEITICKLWVEKLLEI